MWRGVRVARTHGYGGMADVQGAAVVQRVNGQSQQTALGLALQAQAEQALQDPGLPSDHGQNAVGNTDVGVRSA